MRGDIAVTGCPISFVSLTVGITVTFSLQPMSSAVMRKVALSCPGEGIFLPLFETGEKFQRTTCELVEHVTRQG